jgi:hypothetical protein
MKIEELYQNMSGKQPEEQSAHLKWARNQTSVPQKAGHMVGLNDRDGSKPAYRSLGDAKFFCGAGEALMPSRGLEGFQGIQRWQARAHRTSCPGSS